jgi:hypothetical protein
MSSSHLTPRWREMDSNHRYPAKFFLAAPSIPPIHLPQCKHRLPRDHQPDDLAANGRADRDRIQLGAPLRNGISCRRIGNPGNVDIIVDRGAWPEAKKSQQAWQP